MTRTKIKCEHCGREISKSNYSKHIRSHENGNYNKYVEHYHLDHDDLFCKFCGEEYKNRNSLAQHEIRCKLNPNKIDTSNSWKNSSTDRVVWNKGLTKESDKRLEEAGKKISIALKGKPGHSHTEEFKEKQRQNALKSGFGGFLHRKGIYYNGIKLDSSYEVLVAESLDSHNIKWERPGRFPYHIDNTLHYYTPDFYLPDYDVYLDPKNDFLIENINPTLGYKDIDKIHQVEIENNIKIIILNKEQLNWESIIEMI